MVGVAHYEAQGARGVPFPSAGGTVRNLGALPIHNPRFGKLSFGGAGPFLREQRSTA